MLRRTCRRSVLLLVALALGIATIASGDVGSAQLVQLAHYPLHDLVVPLHHESTASSDGYDHSNSNGNDNDNDNGRSSESGNEVPDPFTSASSFMGPYYKSEQMRKACELVNSAALVGSGSTAGRGGDRLVVQIGSEAGLLALPLLHCMSQGADGGGAEQLDVADRNTVVVFEPRNEVYGFLQANALRFTAVEEARRRTGRTEGQRKDENRIIVENVVLREHKEAQGDHHTTSGATAAALDTSTAAELPTSMLPPRRDPATGTAEAAADVSLVEYLQLLHRAREPNRGTGADAGAGADGSTDPLVCPTLLMLVCPSCSPTLLDSLRNTLHRLGREFDCHPALYVDTGAIQRHSSGRGVGAGREGEKGNVKGKDNVKGKGMGSSAHSAVLQAVLSLMDIPGGGEEVREGQEEALDYKAYWHMPLSLPPRPSDTVRDPPSSSDLLTDWSYNLVVYPFHTRMLLPYDACNYGSHSGSSMLHRQHFSRRERVHRTDGHGVGGAETVGGGGASFKVYVPNLDGSHRSNPTSNDAGAGAGVGAGGSESAAGDGHTYRIVLEQDASMHPVVLRYFTATAAGVTEGEGCASTTHFRDFVTGFGSSSSAGAGSFKLSPFLQSLLTKRSDNDSGCTVHCPCSDNLAAVVAASVDQFWHREGPQHYHFLSTTVSTVGEESENTRVRHVLDCFTFYNEVEMLFFRMAELQNVVDRMILAEAAVTHSGAPKRLWYDTYKGGLFEAGFESLSGGVKAPAVVHVIVSDMPGRVQTGSKDATDEGATTRYYSWMLEGHQRNALQLGIQRVNPAAALITGAEWLTIHPYLQPDDLLFVNDVDEVLNANLVSVAATTTAAEFIINRCLRMSMDFYYYNINSQVANKVESVSIDDAVGGIGEGALKMTKAMWDLGFVINYQAYVDAHPQLQLQDYRMNFEANQVSIMGAGWHFSYFGTVDRIINKLRNFAHQEYNDEYYTDPVRLAELIRTGRDILGRGDEKMRIQHVPVGENSNLPLQWELLVALFA